MTPDGLSHAPQRGACLAFVRVSAGAYSSSAAAPPVRQA